MRKGSLLGSTSLIFHDPARFELIVPIFFAVPWTILSSLGKKGKEKTLVTATETTAETFDVGIARTSEIEWPRKTLGAHSAVQHPECAVICKTLLATTARNIAAHRRPTDTYIR